MSLIEDYFKKLDGKKNKAKKVQKKSVYRNDMAKEASVSFNKVFSHRQERKSVGTLAWNMKSWTRKRSRRYLVQVLRFR